MDEVETVTAQAWSLLGQAYFQMADFRKSMSSMKTAISLQKKKDTSQKKIGMSLLQHVLGNLKKKLVKRKHFYSN